MVLAEKFTTLVRHTTPRPINFALLFPAISCRRQLSRFDLPDRRPSQSVRNDDTQLAALSTDRSVDRMGGR